MEVNGKKCTKLFGIELHVRDTAPYWIIKHKAYLLVRLISEIGGSYFVALTRQKTKKVKNAIPFNLTIQLSLIGGLTGDMVMVKHLKCFKTFSHWTKTPEQISQTQMCCYNNWYVCYPLKAASPQNAEFHQQNGSIETRQWKDPISPFHSRCCQFWYIDDVTLLRKFTLRIACLKCASKLFFWKKIE